jgi:hypothetical protein
MPRMILFLLIVVLALTPQAFGQELLSEKYYPDNRLVKEFFFHLPVHTDCQPLYPGNVERQIQELLSSYNDAISLEWTGTADLEIGLFDDLEKNILVSDQDELKTLVHLADERALYAANKWGGLAKPGKLVKSSQDRGIILSITIELETARPMPNRVEWLIDTLYIYQNQIYELSGLAQVVWNNDSSGTHDIYFESGSRFLKIDKLTSRLQTSSTCGIMHILALYQIKRKVWMAILPVKVKPLLKL